ncbi:NAD-binding protein, partial [Patescibacteria group bacterium]|nr:NAD-binding protein [Patescibacteria group bacterium]
MKITVIGTGYVGLVTGTIFSDLGNEVTCVDVDPKKIAGLKKGDMPIYEPGLEEIVKKNYKAKRLFFTTELEKTAQESEVLFIAVGTPQDKDGRADLQYVKAVAKEIGQVLD